MSAAGEDLWIDVPIGRVDILHRLALAVEPIDALTGGRAGRGLRIGRETSRSMAVAPRRPRTAGQLGEVARARSLADHGTSFVLCHGRGVPTAPGSIVIVRIDDTSRRWVPRRMAVPIWVRDEVRTADSSNNPTPYIPAEYRLIRPWLFPGAANQVSTAATGVRLRIMEGTRPVRWARIEAFGPGGASIGWAHGDEQGQVLFITDRSGNLPPPPPATFDIALRVHAPALPAGGDPPTVDPFDPLSDLVAEPIARSAAPPAPPAFDSPAIRGETIPPGYRTASQDRIVTLTVGRVVPWPDIQFL